MEILIIIIIIIIIFMPSKNSERKILRCRSCSKTFNEEDVNEWLDDNDEIDDNFGINPCCPYCGSSDVDQYYIKEK